MKGSPVKAPKAKAAAKAPSKLATKVATKKAAPAATKKVAAKKGRPPLAKKAADVVVKKAVAKKMTAKKAAAPKAEKASRRPKQRDVRNRVIALLEAGPMTMPALMKGGNFSQSALYLNLKSLRDSGMVQSQRNGKSVTIFLASKGAKAPAAPAPKVEAAPVVKPPRKKRVSKLAPKAEPIEGELIAAQPKVASSPSADLVPAVAMPRQLQEALSAVRYRLSPIDRAQEKLIVLDELARTMPEAVAEVLRSLMDDVSKLGGV